jgi:putative ABC transport system permease protein
MLELTEISKDYVSSDTIVNALKKISLRFRNNEFVSILGHSGCGKTTLLNIIGGLDQYTSGDLKINGISTKNFKDRDWDAYRNNSIGFVFQSYNLIPHQSVLANVELALTLSGVSKGERKRRAIEALEKVGLKEQIHKKPNQMSGGQMQRVAIARALVNDPDILLADEPTGALDTETSIQIMELIREIAKDRLVIMVTHNPELAANYSTRIIRLKDGEITHDSNIYTEEQMKADYEAIQHKAEVEALALKNNTGKANREHKKKNRTSMSFFTALSLSTNNLLTKKTRTILTAFAGSIGIIGIALILSISNGIQNYIDRVQRDTLSSYPIQLQAETVDISSMLESMTGAKDKEVTYDDDLIHSNNIMGEFINTMVAKVKNNNLKEFKKYIEDGDSNIQQYTSDIQYSYNVPLNIYDTNTTDGPKQINPSTVMNRMYGMSSKPTDTTRNSGGSMMSMGGAFVNGDAWNQLFGNQQVLDAQYDVLAGKWPENYNEVVLIVDKNNLLDDYTMYSLGLKDPEEVSTIYKKMMVGEAYEPEDTAFSYDEIMQKTYKLILPTAFYQYNNVTKRWDDLSENESFMKNVIDEGTEIKIVGIVKPNEDAVNQAATAGIGYTKGLMEYIINGVNNSDLAKAQLADPETDVFTGIPFDNDKDTPLTMDDVNAYISTLSETEQAQMNMIMSQMSEDEILAKFSESLKAQTTNATLDSNKSKLGITSLDNPSEIDLYATSFESKEAITKLISDYNKKMTDDGKDENVINYTDYVGIIMSSVSTIINAISYVLIAFVAISLVVSSIMIGIITYISVLERTKEIGILRSIGASKKDISRVFNAETMIEGLVSGIFGIVLTLLLCIPANAIIKNLTSIANVAKLPLGGAIILVLISMILTMIAGFIPAKLAAKKDPVVALRTE